MGAEIVGRPTGLLHDASEHVRPNLLVIVKCKHDGWPAVAIERPMRAGTCLEPISKSKVDVPNECRLVIPRNQDTCFRPDSILSDAHG
jgi:hypothetical protein